MRKLVLTVALLASLTACAATDPQSSFPIEPGALRADELPLDSYAPVMFSSRVFDVVNQDMTAESNTGLAGKVDPMPVDILSAYAAKKFRASGGIFNTRFVVRQAQFSVQPAHNGGEKSWFDRTMGIGQTYGEADMTVTVNAMLVASRASDGATATITATTTQNQKLGFNSSHAERRKAYMALMKNALDALDAEFTRQLPDYFGDVVLK